jgi:hypothetical protein
MSELYGGYLETVRAITGDNGLAMTTQAPSTR